MSLQIITSPGQDSCGKFVVRIPDNCHVCRQLLVDAAVQYVSWTHEIPIESTLLKRRSRHIGITCGCYAKLVRQIAHIMDKRGQKGNPV